MRYAIIADIHSNLEALEVVLEDIYKLSLDRILCLGDIVGYGANPNECCDLVFKEDTISIIGNHDYAAINTTEKSSFNTLAYRSAIWTYETLESRYKDVLSSSLSTYMLDKECVIVHGALTNRMDYILYNDIAEDNIKCLKECEGITVCFYGHTHIKKVWKAYKQNVYPVSFNVDNSNIYYLDDTSRYLINPGSVGQPRDKDNRASYLIFNTDNMSILYRAIPYNIASAREKIHKVGLPTYFGDRLMYGV